MVKEKTIRTMSFLLLCFVVKIPWRVTNGSGQVIQLNVTGFLPCEMENVSQINCFYQFLKVD